MEHETYDVLTKFQSFGLFLRGGGTSHKRIKSNVTCSDPEFLTTFFFFFISLFYSLQRGSDCLSMVLFQRKLLFPGFRGSSIINLGGSTIFQWVHLFPGWGIQMLFSIETHITCEFSGGGGRTPPPIWIRA